MNNYFKELARRLNRAGIQTAPPEKDRLPILWNGEAVLFVSPAAYVWGEAEAPMDGAAKETCRKAAEIAQEVREYVSAVEQAPPLRAAGLSSEEFRRLAEFNDVVLAGRELPNGYGYQFVTWNWDKERGGLRHGHYYEDSYQKAMEDFATRSGLVQRERLFSNGRLTEIFRAVAETLDSGRVLTTQREKLLESALGQIRDTVPDLQDRITRSNEAEYAESMRIRAEAGDASAQFPVETGDYEQDLGLLNALGIGDVTGADCFIQGIASNVPALKLLEGTEVNVDEMDFLTRRLDSFDQYELLQFNAAASLMDSGKVAELINLIYCCQQTTVIADFSDLEAVGHRHCVTVHGGAGPEELAALDGYQTALALINSGAGVVTPYGVLYSNGMKLEQVYRGGSFPDYDYGSAFLTVEVWQDGQSQESAFLYLPAAGFQIARMLLRAGMDAACGYSFRVVDDRLPDAVRESGRYEYDSNLESFYNYERYGSERAAEENGQFTELGYIAYKINY